jgi:hypothetical protein
MQLFYDFIYLIISFLSTPKLQFKTTKLAKDILHHVSVDSEQKKRLELEQAEAVKESMSFNKITNKIIFYS